jgi:hypothetical protein
MVQLGREPGLRLRRLIIPGNHQMMKRTIEAITSTGRNRMKFLLGVLVLFVVMDGLVTERLVGGGLAREANPLLEPLVGGFGFMVLKVAGALVCTLILWDVYRRFPRLAVGATWCFVAAYGLILAWNSSIFFG